jgi:tetrapyrrole methylase family protein/MazG family protein
MTLYLLGLGAGDIDDLTRRAWQTLENATTVYLRTERHPCVPYLPQNSTYHSFDHLYETHDDFADVYNAIVTTILSQAKDGDVVYAVPGDPLVGEETGTRLLAEAQKQNINVQVIHGISFIEPMLAQVGVDAVDGLQIHDAITIGNMHHPPLNPEFGALIAQVYSRPVASNLKLTLMNQYPDEFEVTLVHGAGTGNVQREILPLYEIDRSEHINHLTSLYVPPLGEYTSFEAFQEIIAHLRAPEGCPWDRKQTHQTLRPYLIEEAYEVLEAIDDDDPEALAGELGDLLLQIVLHTQIAIEDGEFYMTDVLEYVNRKMIRRHPHVWGDVDVNGDAQQVTANWEQIKQTEQAKNGDKRKSLLDGIPKELPALLTASKYNQKVAKVGFDWQSVEGVHDKVHEELQEIFDETDTHKKIREIGDLIFVLVNWMRWLGEEDAESILREINAKFLRRFQYVEQRASEQGRELTDMTLDEMETLWVEGKARGL